MLPPATLWLSPALLVREQGGGARRKLLGSWLEGGPENFLNSIVQAVVVVVVVVVVIYKFLGEKERESQERESESESWGVLH